MAKATQIRIIKDGKHEMDWLSEDGVEEVRARIERLLDRAGIEHERGTSWRDKDNLLWYAQVIADEVMYIIDTETMWPAFVAAELATLEQTNLTVVVNAVNE
ncbi:MAG: hypothetical protein ACYS7Y_28700 [Planctomycetota bacterium]